MLAASKLIRSKKVEVLVGTFSLAEAVFLSEIHKKFLGIPVLLLTPTAMPSPLVPLPSNLIQMSHNFSFHMQCLAAIVGYFRWQRVTILYEKTNLFSMDAAHFTVLSDSLRFVDATIEKNIAFPPISSMSDPEISIEQQLYKLKGGSNRVFILLHSSLQLATCLFEKANQMGMVNKGYVWILSDEISSLLESADSSVIASMQGVLGYKTNILDSSKPSYKEFELKFKQNYFTEFSYDLGIPIPSFFALRAYDVIHAINKAKTASGNSNSKELMFQKLLLTNFQGLSENISFKNGELGNIPTFQIINVVGKSYRELAFWSSEFGFSTKLPTQSGRTEARIHHANVELGPIYWPGGQQEVPRGWSFGATKEKALRIAVPASGAFHLVNVSVVAHNQTSITGFVIDVFMKSLTYLHYDLSFELVPFYGRYDDMVHHIHQRVSIPLF